MARGTTPLMVAALTGVIVTQPSGSPLTYQVFQDVLQFVGKFQVTVTAGDGIKSTTVQYQVTVTEPILNAAPAIVHPEELGGTRHFSADRMLRICCTVSLSLPVWFTTT